ncbi:hypothetical protein MUP01_10900 [Candidatus Bathyarchaeota archaeon]|nr:hypothetical protein [Candidatus Bathyarchaeota archaeon]
MSLSEKAKTSLQIWQALENMDKTVDGLSKWVRLSDHQQEIDKYKTFRDNAIKKWCESQDDCKEKSEGYAKVCARLHERIIDLERERGEQKKKLQQFDIYDASLREQKNHSHL